MNGGITNFIGKSGEKFYTGFSGMYKLTDSGHELIFRSALLSALIILIPILSVISILFFKSKRIQKTLVFIGIVISFCLIITVTYYSCILVKNNRAELVPGIKMIIPLIILLAGILAYMGVLKDDRLVKSYDRLR